MSTMSELLAVLDELVECGRKLTKTAENLRSFYSSSESSQKEEQTCKTTETAAQATITLEEVRAVLA